MATVTVDGQTFESPKYFSTIEEAESAAAEVALMSLPQEENQQETFAVKFLPFVFLFPYCSISNELKIHSNPPFLHNFYWTHAHLHLIWC